jgi:ribose 5-phosphate isomerase B
MDMDIAIGSDHRALELKLGIVEFLRTSGHHVKDAGSYTEDSIDYPDIAEAVCKMVLDGKYQFGILICGTGIGMSIAANKVKGIRAALCRDLRDADRARSHNNANVLCLGSETTGIADATTIIDKFIRIQFEGGRHLRRINKISQLENK